MGRHEEWRKAAKKARRKRLRRAFAIKRDEIIREEEEKKLKSPRYQQWLKEQEELEEFALEEEKRVQEERERKWIEDDRLAHERWKKHQELLKEESLRKAKEEQLMKEELERKQKKIEEEKEKKKLEEDLEKQRRELLLAEIDRYMNGERNDLPEECNIISQTQPGKAVCPFFAKTGACKYQDGCSRNHIKPGYSKTLLFPGFYSHFLLDSAKHSEYDTDISLEFEYSETYKHFVEFYNDIKYEFDKYGKLTQLVVCQNTSAHLKGNVYVSFSSEREALTVFRRFNGRYYAGRPISVEFIDIPVWKSAICGLQYSNRCPKGNSCNFLHVFKNPGRQFHNADKLIKLSSKKSQEEWRWSESPEHEQQPTRKHRRSKDRDSSRKRRRNRSRSHSRSRSRNRSRCRSRTRRRKDTKKHNSERRNGRISHRSSSSSLSEDSS